jgi:hypothetical protein
MELIACLRENMRHLLPDQLAVGEDKAQLDGILSRMHRIHQFLTICYLPLVIATMIFSCFWAYKEGSFQKYLDPSKDWEACLTTSNFVQIPVSEAVNIGFTNLERKLQDVFTTIFECPTSLSECYNSSQCTAAISETCFAPFIDSGQNITAPVIENPQVRVGELLESLRYIGFQTVIFSLISHAALNRALRHPTWLPATICVMIWCFFAVLTYYTIDPILPIPTETNGTTLLFFFYSKKYIFNQINSGDNLCSVAYDTLWAYLTLLICILINMLACVLLACRAEVVRFYHPNRKIFQPLRYTRTPAILCGLIIVLYALIVTLKITTSVTMITAIHDFHQTLTEVAQQGTSIWFDNNFYPFQQGSLDLNSLLFVGAIASVIRGYSRESTSAFRLAATMAFAYSITSYPGLVGAFRYSRVTLSLVLTSALPCHVRSSLHPTPPSLPLRFYVYNDFQNDSNCKNFFLEGLIVCLLSYPDPIPLSRVLGPPPSCSKVYRGVWLSYL